MSDIEIERFLKASPRELEKLSWYGITGALGLGSFNNSGRKPIELISKLVRITTESSVLVAGCGAGSTAVHLAEISGATVYGIDISADAVRAARALAQESPAHDRLHFQVCDASALPFPPCSFDAVVAEYMAFFLPADAFQGFSRTLRPGGFIALAEPMKDPRVNAKADRKITAAEGVYSDLLGYRFHVPTSSEYIELLTRAGFTDVRIHERFREPGLSERIRAVGGLGNLFRIVGVTLRLMWESPIIRKKMLQAGRLKRVFIQNPSTAKFIFQAVMTGQKP